MKRMPYFIVVSLLEISPYVSTVACSGSLLAEGIEDSMYSSTMAIGHSYVYGGCKNQHLDTNILSEAKRFDDAKSIADNNYQKKWGNV